jgi:hypothetical protein
MTRTDQETQRMEDPEARLEEALIAEYLRVRGVDSNAVRTWPAFQLKRVLKEASTYASAKLAEVESRAHFVHELHGQR